MLRAIPLALIAAFGALSAAAAELPTRQAKPSEKPIRKCEIQGKPGFLALDGQTCIRLSGYVSGQVSAGTVK
jgi:hypothetical protein